MISNKEHIILALQLINSSGNLDMLLELEYNYSDIADLTGILRKKGHVDFINNNLRLTKSGRYYLSQLNKELRREGIAKFISPLLQYKTEKLGLYDIYLPALKIVKDEREL